MTFYERTIRKKIESFFDQGKVIIIYGARRVGKTTLVKHIADQHDQSLYLNCELLPNKSALESTNPELLISYIGKTTKLVVLDEAQQIANIGLVLKILVDTFPELQIIATGSSSFELGNRVSEPLTGRSRVFLLLPLSFQEILSSKDLLTATSLLERMLRFGTYPEVFNKSDSDSIEELNSIASNYLYKDILQLDNLRRTDLLGNLLRAIAFQIGSEVSFNELANLLGENVHTIKKYISLLEKAFIIFRLYPLSRNLRNEIGKGQKIYFYDLGIRNAIIQNFNPVISRNDIEGLWENYIILERLKYNSNLRKFLNTYYWRTYQQAEIDYIEESGGKLTVFECKFSPNARWKIPNNFTSAYDVAETHLVHRENFWKFLRPDEQSII